MEDPVVPLERNLHGHLLAGLSWERQFEKVPLETRLGKGFKIGNVHLSTEQKDCSHLCMWTISNWQAEQKTSNRLGKFWWKTLIWTNEHHSSTTYIWVALKESATSALRWWRTTEICAKPGFLLVPRKTTYKSFRETWCRNHISNKTTQQFYKVATPCVGWPSIQWRGKWNLWENCHNYAHKLSSNVCIWLVLGNPIYYGLWTNLHDRLQNGPKLVTKRLNRLVSYIHHTCEYKQYLCG